MPSNLNSISNKCASWAIQKRPPLQAQLLKPYQDALLDKVAKHFLKYHDCHYRVSHKSKLKKCVTFGCTRYQVTAAGVVILPWTDYKSCKKIIDNDPTLDIKNNCQSCPATGDDNNDDGNGATGDGATGNNDDDDCDERRQSRLQRYGQRSRR